MDSGSILPVDDYYFQNIRESGYEKRISELETELADKEKQLAETQAETQELYTQLATELKAEHAQELAEMRADIARKDGLIEQMREALRLALPEARSTHVEQTILAALAAERGE